MLLCSLLYLGACLASSFRCSQRAQEIDGHCRQLILDHTQWCDATVQMPRPSPCVFGDVSQIFPPGSLPDPPTGDFPALVQAANKAPLLCNQFCYAHNRRCRLFGPDSKSTDMDISGLPCPDMSKAGLQKFENGPTSIVFVAHAKMHIQKGTKLLIIENVPEAFAAN